MLDVGVELAFPGSRVLCYVEQDSFSASVLLARMESADLEPCPIFAGDLADVDWAAFAGIANCVVAGFPCQPYSVCGKQKGTEDPRWIWDDIAECIRIVGCERVFLENVPGMFMGGIGHVLGSLASLGYDAVWGSLRASAVGASHRRERVFIMANTIGSASQRRGDPGVVARESGAVEEKGHQRQRGGGAPDDSGQAMVPLFAPGPDDPRWEDILQLDPTLEPAVCRTSPWMAERMERLRVCGNGVVPLQAAAAFVELSRRLNERM